MNERALRARLAQAGQEHLADHFDQLEDRKRAALLPQLEALDLDLLAEQRAAPARRPASHLEPIASYVAWRERGSHTPAAEAGRQALGRSRVAYALLAGGQATRLGLHEPKGTYPIGPATQRSLFRIFAERLLRAQRDFGAQPRLALTTSSSTDVAIRSFFEQHDCFGLDRERLAFARQDSLPALDEEGRVLLAAPDRIARAPDGHGGALASLERSGILERWAADGVEIVCTFQVDNPLLMVVDPDFVGRLLLGDAPIATKVVLKRAPDERVGLVARAGGKPAVVEYSEIDEELARARDEIGGLRFRLGSIAVHAFELEFLRSALAQGLPLHRARKRIPTREGARLGYKFERFAFDLFPRAHDVTVVEALREREFEPLKNAQGDHSPDSVRAALDAEYRRWYREAGKEPPPDAFIELSPLEAIGPEDLAES